MTEQEVIEKCLHGLTPGKEKEALYMDNGELYPTAFYRLRRAQVVAAISIIRKAVVPSQEALMAFWERYWADEVNRKLGTCL